LLLHASVLLIVQALAASHVFIVTRCVQINVATPPPATQVKLDKRKAQKEANVAKEQLAAPRRAGKEEKLLAKEAAVEADMAAQMRAMQVRTRNCILCTCCLALQHHLQV
jgi:hypothetical protein